MWFIDFMHGFILLQDLTSCDKVLYYKSLAFYCMHMFASKIILQHNMTTSADWD